MRPWIAFTHDDQAAKDQSAAPTSRLIAIATAGLTGRLRSAMC
jgi:hypothetical protein